MGLLCNEGGWGMKAVQGEGRRGRGGLSLLGASLVSLPFKPGWHPEGGPVRMRPPLALHAGPLEDGRLAWGLG